MRLGFFRQGRGGAKQTKPASAGSIESAQADESFYSPRLLVCGRFANKGCSPTYISQNHAVIGIEDLNVSGMLANHKLAKAIADMGFYEFRRQLEYKCELYGSKLVVVDRFFPSSKRCSNCLTVKESLSLAERTYCCSECGFQSDRDLNASLNLELGVRATVIASGLEGYRHPQVEGGRNVSNC